MKDRLEKWLKANLIQYQTRADLLFIKGWGTAMIQDMSKQEHIFKKDKNGDYVFDCAENYDFLKADDIFYVVFEFGDRFFYVDIREEKMPFHVLKYVGDPVVSDIKCDFYPLGIHSGYELLNGSGSLSTWVKKAKFLGYKGLGICDYNTFAGSLDLQREASGKELRYCFGYSLTMVIGDDKVGAKVYANTQKGFRNILRIQKTINVDREDGLIDYLELLALADGNCLVFDKWSGEWLCNNITKLDDFVKAFDGFVYFQVDTSEYRAERIDVRVLNSLKAYFDTFYVEPQNYDHDQHPFYYIKNIRPVLIQDMYYVDADDWRNKMVLNKIDIGAAHEQSYMQYMKPLDELYDEMRFEEMVLLDTEVNGWLIRINRTVEWTKEVINKVLWPLLRDLAEIRGMDVSKADIPSIVRGMEQFYYQIDAPFRNWMDGISASASKEEKVQAWKEELKAMLMRFGDDLLRGGSPRDYSGIVYEDGNSAPRVKNNATVYHSFMRNLNKHFA